MTASMTAFARTERELEGTQLIWEIRSVNHRYLDINLKLPEELKTLDTASRKQITELLNRGRIDLHLKLEISNHLAIKPIINLPAVNTLVGMLSQIEQAHPQLASAKSIDILRWPGIVVDNQIDAETINRIALDALEEGLSLLIESRQREGARLESLIVGRVTQCQDIVDQLADNMSSIQQKLKHKWLGRVEEIATKVDQDRIAQEIAILLTKNDVSEELDRLHAHLSAVDQHLKSNKAIGRNLDFLMQELNREANTLGSKSVDQEMSNASIELKVLIDQMREQVQNIE